MRIMTYQEFRKVYMSSHYGMATEHGTLIHHAYKRYRERGRELTYKF